MLAAVSMQGIRLAVVSNMRDKAGVYAGCSINTRDKAGSSVDAGDKAGVYAGCSVNVRDEAGSGVDTRDSWCLCWQ